MAARFFLYVLSGHSRPPSLTMTDIDKVEEALKQKALEGDVRAIEFYLCNKDADNWSKPSSNDQARGKDRLRRLTIIAGGEERTAIQTELWDDEEPEYSDNEGTLE